MRNSQQWCGWRGPVGFLSRAASRFCHGTTALSFDITTKSVRLPRQFEQRKRSSRSGVSPRPSLTSRSRSASAACRHALHQTCSFT